MIYLIKTTEQYRCGSEEEAAKLIEEAKNASDYEVTKHSTEVKTLKQKGEIIDEWQRVTITKVFSEEKDPYGNLMPKYTKSGVEED